MTMQCVTLHINQIIYNAMCAGGTRYPVEVQKESLSKCCGSRVRRSAVIIYNAIRADGTSYPVEVQKESLAKSCASQCSECTAKQCGAIR